MAEEQRRPVDGATQKMLEKARRDGVETAWDRHATMEPQCKFGTSGLCCRNCFMGPCRVIEGVPGMERGICGATASTIVSRNFARMVAAGTAAHSDHGRSVAETLLMAATGKAPDYSIRDVQKLNAVARIYGIDPAGKSTAALAELVGLTALSEFGKHEGEQRFLQRAPEPRQKIWKENGIAPRAVDREVTEVLHRTTMGVDQDYRTIIAQASRCALADGWGGSMIATELQDILFGTPIPRQARANLGVLREDTVNIIIHGHEPTLSEMIVLAAQDPKLIAKAKAAGAKGGITVAGMCCTANETLMRHGVPIAGNSMQQELALATGAVEAMVVDVQCIMQSVVARRPVVPQQDHHHLGEGAHHRRAAHAVRRAPRARCRQGDRRTRDRQPPEPRQSRNPLRGRRPRGRLQPRDHPLHARRPVPRLVSPAQRQHHERPHPRRRRRRRVQLAEVRLRRGQLGPRHRADLEGHPRRPDRVHGHRQRQAGAVAAGGQGQGRAGPARDLRHGRHPAGAPFRLVRGQFAHPDRLLARWCARAASART